MKIQIWMIPDGWLSLERVRKSVPFEILKRGYVEAEAFEPNEFFHLCNWLHWAETKPEHLFSDVDSVSSNVIFHNPEDNTFHLALPMGWLVRESLEEIINYCTHL